MTAVIYLRLAPELKALLRTAAKRKGIPLNSYMKLIIQKGLAKDNPKKGNVKYD